MTQNGNSAATAAEDGYAAEDRQERELVPALLRGWRRRCPNCGKGPMMSGYLTVRPGCTSCGQEFSHHRAEDAPGWITMLVVAIVVVLGLMIVEVKFTPPLWVHWAIWPAITLGLSAWLLPRLKGAIIAFQWARRMCGFGDFEPSRLAPPESLEQAPDQPSTRLPEERGNTDEHRVVDTRGPQGQFPDHDE